MELKLNYLHVTMFVDTKVVYYRSVKVREWTLDGTTVNELCQYKNLVV